MQGKIALEEHFATDATLMDSAGFVPDDHWPELRSRLLDTHDRRLREMDAQGIALTIVSLNAPAVQAVMDPTRALAVAREANDALAEAVARRPDRFRGFAALPMQDPEAAARELERCVRQHGFVGALVNGFTQGGPAGRATYYDHPAYRPFWAAVAALDVPFYLHPRNPLPEDSGIYAGAEWLLGPTWAFGQETAVHALRLIGSGLFDEQPSLQIVLGHLGEGLPYSLWRIDHRNGWVKAPPKHRAKRKIADYVQANFHLTTAGNFRSQTLIDAMLELGAGRLLFSTDWPFENMDHAAIWFDAAPISEADRRSIGRDNAIRLFKLEGVA